MEKDMTQQEKEQNKRTAEELAEDFLKLPQRFQDKLAGAIMMAQLATAEKAG